MELPKYSGTIHPEEWLKQVKTYCCLKEIENEQKILKICKLMIDSTIKVPNEIKSFDELIKALKSHTTFNIFKDSCKRKLQVMKYIPERESNYTATFLAKFRSICNDAEINDQEIKNLLFNTYSNEFFKNEFIKRVNDINSVDEIFKRFSDVIFDESKVIKYGSSIALKHVSTGRYLSSYDISYRTSQRKVLFAGEKFCNSYALWFLEETQSCNLKKHHQRDTVFYGDRFYLKHKETNNILGISYHYKSPASGHSEAFCDHEVYSNSELQFVNVNSKNINRTLYLKSKDIINLKEIGKNLCLRSHDFTFTINNESFQEVVGHADRIGANDEWCIELID